MVAEKENTQWGCDGYRLILSRPKNRRRMQNLTSKGLRVDEKPTRVVYYGGMMEQADNRDLKSRGFNPYGFEPRSLHHSKDNFMG